MMARDKYAAPWNAPTMYGPQGMVRQLFRQAQTDRRAAIKAEEERVLPVSTQEVSEILRDFLNTGSATVTANGQLDITAPDLLNHTLDMTDPKLESYLQRRTFVGVCIFEVLRDVCGFGGRNRYLTPVNDTAESHDDEKPLRFTFHMFNAEGRAAEIPAMLKQEARDRLGPPIHDGFVWLVNDKFERRTMQLDDGTKIDTDRFADRDAVEPEITRRPRAR
jgi:hypothetical protein